MAKNTLGRTLDSRKQMLPPGVLQGPLIALVFALSLQLSGCSEVTSSAPVGSKVISLDATSLDGYWSCTGIQTFSIVVLAAVSDSESGELSIRYMDQDHDANSGAYVWKVREFAGLVRSTEHLDGKFYFLSVTPQDEKRPGYAWGLIKWDPSKPGRLLFWAPNHHTLVQLVQQGRIKGEESGMDSLEITVDDGQLEDMIPAPIWKGIWKRESTPSAGESYVPDAFGWTEPWFCERVEY